MIRRAASSLTGAAATGAGSGAISGVGAGRENRAGATDAAAGCTAGA